MSPRLPMVLLPLLVLLALAGCGGDPAAQVVRNQQMRQAVLDSLARHTPLVVEAVDRFAQTDSTRVQMVDHLLRNTDVAKQVLVRIGTSPEALDMAMQVALRDSVTRGHLVQVAGAIVKASSGRH